MIAKGKARQLLKILMRIQYLAGEAKGAHGNDRDPSGFEIGQKAIDEIERLCIDELGKYDPIT